MSISLPGLKCKGKELWEHEDIFETNNYTDSQDNTNKLRHRFNFQTEI